MSLETGRFRLLLADLVGADARSWPVAAVAEALGVAVPEAVGVQFRGEFEHLLTTERGRREGALILTFGRVSCGEGDFAPEVTSHLADSAVPALATAPRLLWTERHPEAYLFRNVAAVIGRSLVVNLPADGAMVAEAAGFLAGVASHALEKIAGGDEECGR
jgi:molybdopterin biosynthesis enzyme MoaB